MNDNPLPRGSGQILYVDDEQALVEIGTRMLRSLGYETLGLTSSEEALEVFQSNPHQFDLVVTDYTMPKLTGEALARKILSIRPDIPILVATGFSERVTEERVREIGIGQLLLKPLSTRELAEAVKRALHANRTNL